MAGSLEVVAKSFEDALLRAKYLRHGTTDEPVDIYNDDPVRRGSSPWALCEAR